MSQNQKTKIMVFGTFDMIHLGHLNFFVQARKLAPNPFLVVSIARDKNVFRIKGKLPKNIELKRLKLVKNVSYVDKAILGGVRNHLTHILKEKPSIIALGYDQKAYVKGLRVDLLREGLSPRIVRLKPYKERVYKTSLLYRNKKDK